MLTIRRLVDRPIIIPDMDPRMGSNINGPSLIRVPDWVEGALGRYYLYFAHHKGSYIRMAYADDLAGPWQMYEPGVLALSQTVFEGHIASPDVLVEEGLGVERRFLMFHHGNGGLHAERSRFDQPTRVAVSADGITYEDTGDDIGRPYFRVFRYEGLWYAVLNRGWLYRSRDPLQGWEEGGHLDVPELTRHVAVEVRGQTLRLFYSVREDTPEHILMVEVDMRRPWPDWRTGEPVSVIQPETDWEGGHLPQEPSKTGWIDRPVRQLRDPGIYVEDGRTYLLYSVAGEAGIGIAEIREA